MQNFNQFCHFIESWELQDWRHYCWSKLFRGRLRAVTSRLAERFWLNERVFFLKDDVMHPLSFAIINLINMYQLYGICWLSFMDNVVGHLWIMVVCLKWILWFLQHFSWWNPWAYSVCIVIKVLCYSSMFSMCGFEKIFI